MASNEEELSESASPSVAPAIPGAQELQIRLATRLAEMRKIDVQDVDITKPYSYYGLTSLELVLLASDLEEWLERPLDATLLWDYPTIESLSNHLATERLK
jgi:acyl carrier protein